MQNQNFNNYGGPYFNPYGVDKFYQNNAYAQPNNYTMKQYDFVSGLDEAKAYPAAAGRTIVLFDKQSSLCYMKYYNERGALVLKYYKLEEMDENTTVNFINSQNNAQTNQNGNDMYVTKDEFEKMRKSLDDNYNKLLKKIDILTAKKENKE